MGKEYLISLIVQPSTTFLIRMYTGWKRYLCGNADPRHNLEENLEEDLVPRHNLEEDRDL